MANASAIVIIVLMIDFYQVTHHYGIRQVLRNVSMRVERGEIVALMGPNGQGKSTLMAIAAGMLWPVSGYAAIDGQRRRQSEEIELAIRQKVVYLAAEQWLPREKSGREWISAVGRTYGVDDARLFPHVERLLDLFDLKEKADATIGSYSTGQRKKIALCSALATDAPIMLLDEPFAGGLDPSGIMALKRVLLHHRAKGDKTILFATPVPELVEEVAQRIAIISEGQLIANGTVAELIQNSGGQSLGEAYERAANPQTMNRISRYFQAEEMK